MTGKLYFVAGEASGDVLGRDVVSALQHLDPFLEIRGTGVALSGDHHSVSPIDVAPLSVVGLLEGARAYGAVKRIVRETVKDIQSFKPDVAILIDSWGFTLRIAQALRKVEPGIKLVKLVGPQVWATRPGRAKTLAETIDHLLCIHAFEVPYYAPYKLKTKVIGHPALSRSTPGNAGAFREKYALASDVRIASIFPGSRPSEVTHMGRDVFESAKLLRQQSPSLRIAFAPSDSIAEQFWSIGELPSSALKVAAEDRFDLMAASDVALACSGTITTEIALQGTPVITGYKSGFFTWFVATKFLLKSKFITLINVAADDEVIPEFLQHDFNAETLVSKARMLLSNEAHRQSQISAQHDALKKMGLGALPAAEIAAAEIIEVLSA
ncbi:MAG: lipid-A-disaccharide synthase [Pseudomonadota bacterium]